MSIILDRRIAVRLIAVIVGLLAVPDWRAAEAAQDAGTPVTACEATAATPAPPVGGRVQLLLEARPPANVRITPETVCIARDVMAARLAVLEVEATLTLTGGYGIVVEVAAEADIVAVTRQVTRVGLLEIVDSRGQTLLVGTLVSTSLGGPEAVLSPADYAGEDVDDAAYETIVGADDIQDAYVELDQFGMSTARVELTESAGDRLYEFTGANIGRPLAIVLDKRVISTPIIQEAVSAQVVISGLFTEEEVAELVASLSSEPLPVQFEIVAVDGTPVPFDGRPVGDP